MADILFDARMARHSGIGTYVRGLLQAFAPDLRARLTLLGDPAVLSEFGAAVSEAREPVYGAREQTLLAWRIRRARPRLLHVPHYNLPLATGVPSVVTVHDLNHVLFPALSRRPLARHYARAMLGAATRRARLVLAGSERTRRDLEHFGVPVRKIRVTPFGVDERFAPPPPEAREATLARLGLEPGYLLYVGNLRAIKNLPRLVEAYRRLASRRAGAPPLVLAGRDQLGPAERRAIEAPGVRRLGEVPDGDLPALYAGASVFAFPSLYEGFGLPPLEAMACGCPVVASTGGALPEVLSDAALLPDPWDTDAIAGALERVLDDAALREDLRRRGAARARHFRWTGTARLTWAAYEEVL